MTSKDFDLDFDFEKEFGIDLSTENNDSVEDDDFDFEKEFGLDLSEDDDTPEEQEKADDADMDLRAILESDFAEEAALFDSEYENDFDYGPEEFPQKSDAPQEAEIEIPEEPEFDLGALDLDSVSGEYNIGEAAGEAPAVRRRQPRTPQKPGLIQGLVQKVQALLSAPKKASKPEPAAQPEANDGRPPRKPVSPMRRFKNEQLPLIIAGAAAILIVFFIFGSISRAITNHLAEKEAMQSSSESQLTQEQLEAEEVKYLKEEAAELAAGYDYEAAIAMLDTFTGDASKYPEIDLLKSEYKQIQSQLIAWNDPGAIPNLSFQVLIADPSRAFSDPELGGQYNKNFVTIDEFQKILEQLYANGYVLVDMDDFIAETLTGDTVTYSAKTLYLPDGKKPVMITETMVNYYPYMIDSDDDGEADAKGAGFASRLVIDSLTGEIKAEMVNSAGETVVGNYDLVPILEDFIKEHPDFSYKGARAILAVTGETGIFGYRTNAEVKTAKGEEYYNQQVEGAKKIVAALKAKGYTIASYTYANKKYGDLSATDIKSDIVKWVNEVLPIVGEADTLVYAKSSDISSTGAYQGGKYNVLKEAGFRFFISNGSDSACTVNSEYVRQLRIMVTGTGMANASSMYSKYFNAQNVLNSLRGNVPQG